MYSYLYLYSQHFECHGADKCSYICVVCCAAACNVKVNKMTRDSVLRQVLINKTSLLAR